MVFRSNVADRLPELRRAAGLSQTSLADGMVARGHGTWRQVVVSRIESGIRAVGFTEAGSLATVLGVPLAALLDEQERLRAVKGIQGVNAAHLAAINRTRKAARRAHAGLLGVRSENDMAPLAQLITPPDADTEPAWAEFRALHDESSGLLRLLGEILEPTTRAIPTMEPK